MSLSHLDERGRAHMVDVGGKPATKRVARATAKVDLLPETLKLLVSGDLPKGDALAVARVAGIMAAKQTPQLIPLCHPLPLTSVTIDIELGDECAVIEAVASTTAQTGVEMEAMTAASVAALALYDMVKGVDKGAQVRSVRLEEKSGGKSGHWRRK